MQGDEGDGRDDQIEHQRIEGEQDACQNDQAHHAVMIRVFIVSCSPLFRPGAAPLLWQGLQRQRLRKYRTLSGGRAHRAASCVSFAALKVRRSGGNAG